MPFSTRKNLEQPSTSLSDFFRVIESGLRLNINSFLSLDLPDTQRNDAENFWFSLWSEIFLKRIIIGKYSWN